ncbi:unnamed protein product [Psylliodes chrysocephalus]|uniref:Uncharacterized protein n=1 Tax=Psylliodes chrysocephalus TaxID=3402493 RepID=A0A9P0DC88_9CUCU|nr:unnamed protein product [Psylliodes chrysocephala]
MEDIENDVSVLVRDGNISSRKRQSTESRSSLRKKKLYAKPRTLNTFIPCTHQTKSFLMCQVYFTYALEIRNRIYSVPDKIGQEKMVSNFLILAKVVRSRQRPNRTKAAKHRLFNMKYTLRPHYLCLQELFSLYSSNEIYTLVKPLEKKIWLWTSQKTGVVIQKTHTLDPYLLMRATILKPNIREYTLDVNIKKLHEAYNSMTKNDLQCFDVSSTRTLILYLRVQQLTCVVSYINNAIDKAKINLPLQLRIHAVYELMKEEHEEDIIYCFDMQQVQFEQEYEKYISLLKRGRQWGSDSFVLEDKQLGHMISDAKKKDINDLLTALYGEWTEIDNLNFYKDIIDDKNLTIVNNNNDDVNERWDCLEDYCCGVHT